jgi:zinc protease
MLRSSAAVAAFFVAGLAATAPARAQQPDKPAPTKPTPTAKPAAPAAPAKPAAPPGTAKPGAKPAAPSARIALPSVETWQLENGLKVAFLRVETAPVVTVQLWYHAGSKDEPRDRRGSAHMFEHIMFKGTQHVPPEEHARSINRVGGYVNALTSEDATYYINLVPSKYLDFAIQLEAERMRNLIFREDMIKTEREVVKEEIRQRDNNPLAKALVRFLAIAFTKHPYAWTSGGAITDLDATTPGNLKAFYDTYYVPNNALLVVVGSVTADEVKAATQKHFGAVPAGPTPPRPSATAIEPAQSEMRREVVEAGQVGVVLDGFKIPEARHPDTYALQVASLILGFGDTSRLHVRLVRTDKSAVQAFAQAALREDPGLFLAGAAFLDPSAQEKVEAALLEEVGKLSTAAPSADEVRKAKNQIQASFVFGLEGVAGLAQQLGQSWILTGDPTQFLRDIEAIDKVTAADVQRVAQTYLVKARLTSVIIPPAAQGGAP